MNNNSGVTSDPKVLIHGNDCIISYTLTQPYILNTQFRLEQLSITDFAIVAKGGCFWCGIVTSPRLIGDVTLTCCTGIATSYSLIVVARANWHKGSLHQWITAVHIDFSPLGIHGLACKNRRRDTPMSSVHFPKNTHYSCSQVPYVVFSLWVHGLSQVSSDWLSYYMWSIQC